MSAPGTLVDAIARALEHRGPLIERLEAEGTDCYRLFHGAVEGRVGLTVDRYGPILLLQSFREPLAPGEPDAIARAVEAAGLSLEPIWNHRGGSGPGAPSGGRPDEGPYGATTPPREGRELGLRYEVRGRWRGRDPLLFLDFRAARRWVRDRANGADVLNLFAYTCGIGVAAAAGGAREVWSVDFSPTALAVGDRNAALNGVASTHQTIRADVLPTLRQLSGLGVKGRGARRRYRRFQARRFDVVILDPPTWATSPFGAVDIVRDYPALFKPAVLSCSGWVLATHHGSTVALEDWLDQLRRCAEKAGRPLRAIEVIAPEADFPSPDGRHPLKIAACQVG